MITTTTASRGCVCGCVGIKFLFLFLAEKGLLSLLSTLLSTSNLHLQSLASTKTKIKPASKASTLTLVSEHQLLTSMVVLVFLIFFFGVGVNAFSSISSSSCGFRRPMALHTHTEDDDKNVVSKFRRVTFGALLTAAATPANARSTKSRTAGYEVQRTEAEWSQLLSPQQNFILRQGGTESPYSSILEGEDRTGLFVCAGCGTPLFNSKEKFHSGTGWPR